MSSRRCLIVRGGWEGHDPVRTTDSILTHLEASGFDVSVESTTEAYLGDLDSFDLIVQCVTMSTIADAEVVALRAAVERGTGLVGWHGGIADSFRDSADYNQLVGGLFVAHPGKPEEDRAGDGTDNYVRHTIEFTDLGREHPVTAGLEDFDLETEQYWVLTDDLNDVLATTTLAARPGDPWSRPVTCPAVWTRAWGKGRIVVATPGHRLEDVEDANVRQIIERGIAWASR